MTKNFYPQPPKAYTTQQIRHLQHVAGILDRDLLLFLRLSENSRTVQWLADAGSLDMNDPLVRFEARHCRTAIRQIPNFLVLRPGRTTWRDATRHAPRVTPHSQPHSPATRQVNSGG